jgi:hypothetical protein
MSRTGAAPLRPSRGACVIGGEHAERTWPSYGRIGDDRRFDWRVPKPGQGSSATIWCYALDRCSFGLADELLGRLLDAGARLLQILDRHCGPDRERRVDREEPWFRNGG